MRKVLLLIWWRFISMWWLRLYSSEFTQAPAIHLLVFCSCMLELTHLHSPPSPQTTQKNKKVMDICLSERGISHFFQDQNGTCPPAKKLLFSPMMDHILNLTGEIKCSSLTFGLFFCFYLLLFSSNKFALYGLLFMTFPEMDFQKWSFRIFIHIMLSWNWGKRFTILNGKSYFLMLYSFNYTCDLFVCLIIHVFIHSIYFILMAMFQNCKVVDPVIHNFYYKYNL